MRASLLYVVVLCLGFVLAACIGDELESIKQRRVIHIGVVDRFLAQGDEVLESFEIHLARRIAKDLLGDEERANIVIIPPHAQEQYALLESLEVDVVLGVVRNEHTQEQIDIATPYMRTDLSIVSRGGDGLAGLFGAPLILMEDSVAEEYFKHNYPQIQTITYASMQECFYALESMPNANLAGLSVILSTWVARNPAYSITVPMIGEGYELAPGVKKGNARLLAWLNAEIATLQKEGFLNYGF